MASTVKFAFKGDAQGFTAAVDKMKKSLGGLSGTLQAVGKLAVGGLLAVGFGRAAGSVTNLGKAAIRAAAELETLKNSFSAQVPEKEMDRFIRSLREYQSASVLDTAETEQATRLLLRYIGDGEKTIEVIRQLDGISRAAGKSLTGVAEAYGRVMAMGLTSRTARAWMSASGMDITAQLAKNQGLTRDEAERKLKSGGFSAVDFARAVEADKAASILQQDAQTLNSALGSIDIAFSTFLEKIGGLANTQLGSSLNAVTAVIQSFSDNFEAFVDAFSAEYGSLSGILANFLPGVALVKAANFKNNFFANVGWQKELDELSGGEAARKMDNIGALLREASEKFGGDLLGAQSAMEGMLERLRTGTSGEDLAAEIAAMEQKLQAARAFLEGQRASGSSTMQYEAAAQLSAVNEALRQTAAAAGTLTAEETRLNEQRRANANREQFLKRYDSEQKTLELDRQANMDIQTRFEAVSEAAQRLGVALGDDLVGSVRAARDQAGLAGGETGELDHLLAMAEAFTTAQQAYNESKAQFAQSQAIAAAQKEGGAKAIELQAAYEAQARAAELMRLGYTAEEAMAQAAQEAADKWGETAAGAENAAKNLQKSSGMLQTGLANVGGGRSITYTYQREDMTAKRQLETQQASERLLAKISRTLESGQPGILVTR